MPNSEPHRFQVGVYADDFRVIDIGSKGSLKRKALVFNVVIRLDGEDFLTLRGCRYKGAGISPPSAKWGGSWEETAKFFPLLYQELAIDIMQTPEYQEGVRKEWWKPFPPPPRKRDQEYTPEAA